MIDECTDIVTGTDVVFVSSPPAFIIALLICFEQRFGIWGPAIHDTLNKDDAEKCTFAYTTLKRVFNILKCSIFVVCKDGWNHDSFSEIISLIIELGKQHCSETPEIVYVLTRFRSPGRLLRFHRVRLLPSDLESSVRTVARVP